MQESFAAEHLDLAGSRIPTDTSGKWAEVVVSLAGIARDRENVVAEAAAADPLLAGRCIVSGVSVSESLHEPERFVIVVPPPATGVGTSPDRCRAPRRL
jgi:hypothetical protein